jgi:prevent-host-death family protein
MVSMNPIDVAEARARLSDLIERAAKGEQIILARAGKPRAMLGPLPPDPRGLRVPGKDKGRFRVKRDFDAPFLIG